MCHCICEGFGFNIDDVVAHLAAFDTCLSGADGIAGDVGGGCVEEEGGEFVVSVGEGNRPCVLWFSVVDVVVEVVLVLLTFGGEEQECIVEVVGCWVVFVV